MTWPEILGRKHLARSADSCDLAGNAWLEASILAIHALLLSRRQIDDGCHGGLHIGSIVTMVSVNAVATDNSALVY